jgi:small GTP-binding protein
MFVEDGALTFRIVLIGDSSVGKTCVVNRFLHDSFKAAEPNTIGVSYEAYTTMRGGRMMELQIWDTAGQEKFKSIGPIYYREAAAALAVFDLTNGPTFESIPVWVDNFRGVAGAAAVVIVVGNKLDLENRKVNAAEARQWCDARTLDYIETSAKTGDGIYTLFETLVDRLAEKGDECATRGIMKYITPPQEEEKKCC